MTATRVYGDPVEHNGVTVIPAGGGGGPAICLHGSGNHLEVPGECRGRHPFATQPSRYFSSRNQATR